MTGERDTVRLPLETLRQEVADATGNSASFLDIDTVTVEETALEVTYEIPDTDVPVVDVIVEGPDGRTDTTAARLDKPSGLKVYGELLRIEYAGCDSETNEILVSVSQRRGDDWQTVLGCGQMWAVETSRDGESVSVTCHVETPGIDADESGDADEQDAERSGIKGDETADFDGILDQE